MSTWNQIWHVVKKDVRRFRWLLLAQCGVVTAAALAAGYSASHLGRMPSLARLSVSSAWTIAVMIMTVLIPALVVQTDSPSRSDAFWASRPIRPIAMLLAKAITLGGFLLALPVAAEALVLVSHSVPTSEMVLMLREGLLVHLCVVLGAATLAALTADLAGFFAAAIAGAAATFVVASLVARVQVGAYDAIMMAQLALPMLLLGTGVLLYQYHSRNPRRSVVATAVGGVVVLALLGAISVPRTSSNVATAPAELITTDIVWGAFDVEPLPRASAGQTPRWALRTTIHLDGTDPRHEYALLSARTRLQLADGTVVSGGLRTGSLTVTPDGGLSSPGEARVVHLGPAGSEPAGADWSIQSVDDRTAPDRVVVANLTQPQLELLAAEGARLELIDGRVDVLASRAFGFLPLREGADLEIDGHQLHVLTVGTAGSSGSLVEVYSEEIRPSVPTPLTPTARGYMRYALVDRATREGVIAPSVRRATYGHASVLAGGWYTRTARVQIETPKVMGESGLVPARSSEWFAGAELMLIEVASVGEFPLTGTVEEVRLGEGAVAPTR